MFVIAGASGHTGKRVAEKLLAAGKAVTVIGRDAARLQSLADKGAKVAVGNLDDAAFLTETLKGAEGFYALIPPSFQEPDFRAYQNKIGSALVEAIKASKVPNVIILSSIGAHLTEDSGMILGLRILEDALSAIEGLNARYLRAGFFMENTFNSIGLVKQAGIWGGFPINGEIPIPMVHTNDIGDKAAELFLSGFTGRKHQYVAGPRDLTQNEAAAILSAAVGLQAPWVQFPYDQAKAGLMQMGVSESLADDYMEFSKAVNDGKLSADFQRDAESTTPTTFESFANGEFKAVFQAA